MHEDFGCLPPGMAIIFNARPERCRARQTAARWTLAKTVPGGVSPAKIPFAKVAELELWPLS